MNSHLNKQGKPVLALPNTARLMNEGHTYEPKSK